MSLLLVKQTKPGQSPQFHINVNVSKGRTLEEIGILIYLFLSDSHCISPPDPPAEKFLQKQFNILSPPAHGESVMYVCDAGANYNRFVDDFNKWNYTITCTKNNTFVEKPNVPWPTCADGIKQKFCVTNIF